MVAPPFDGMSPASGVEHASWIVDSLRPPPDGGVRFRVPSGFEAVVRIHHRFADGRPWSEHLPGVDLAAGSPLHEPWYERVHELEGEFTDDDVDRLIAVLAPQASGFVHVALWNGWGWMHRGSHTTTYVRDGRWHRDDEGEREPRVVEVYDFVDRCPTVDWWGGRTMLLFDGPLEAIPNVAYPLPWGGAFDRQSPQWWWPQDRSWFVATEIDDPCSYVAGSEQLVAEIHASPLETVRVAETDPW